MRRVWKDLPIVPAYFAVFDHRPKKFGALCTCQRLCQQTAGCGTARRAAIGPGDFCPFRADRPYSRLFGRSLAVLIGTNAVKKRSDGCAPRLISLPDFLCWGAATLATGRTPGSGVEAVVSGGADAVAQPPTARQSEVTKSQRSTHITSPPATSQDRLRVPPGLSRKLPTGQADPNSLARAHRVPQSSSCSL